MKNKNMHRAKKAKNDEFYTNIDDISKELNHYRQHFQDKIAYLNCDSEESHFWKYFELNFEFLGLKKLVATHFSDSEKVYKMTLDENGKTKTMLKGNGDFRSPESIEILEACDIVVTNPPFSLFREYVGQLMDYDKAFLVIGNNNAITYKEIFKYIKSGNLWLGVNSNKTMEFRLGDTYEKYNRIENGVKYGKVPAVTWFTNLSHNKRNEKLIMGKKYNEGDYPTYDNYKAINVGKVVDIPVDYFGAMGVPITYLGKHNPKQFEIIKFRKGDDNKDLCINGKSPYFRIIIKRVQNEN